MHHLLKHINQDINLENCERVVVFRKVGEQKIVQLGYLLQANINSILVWILEQYYHHLLSLEMSFSYCNIISKTTFLCRK